jgi:hypothetical protein
MQVDVGTVVVKKSKKPFKSKSKTATVIGVIEHPLLPGRFAYTFEDGSYVECGQCKAESDS